MFKSKYIITEIENVENFQIKLRLRKPRAHDFTTINIF